jgi:hypothetical protein
MCPKERTLGRKGGKDRTLGRKGGKKRTLGRKGGKERTLGPFKLYTSSSISLLFKPSLPPTPDGYCQTNTTPSSVQNYYREITITNIIWNTKSINILLPLFLVPSLLHSACVVQNCVGPAALLASPLDLSGSWEEALRGSGRRGRGSRGRQG